MNKIKTYNESHLHKKLKEHYLESGDLLEEPLEGYYIDLKRNDLLIEFQTKNFGSLKKKFTHLLKKHKIRLVYPISKVKRILKRRSESEEYSKPRKSPKKGNIYDLFSELIRIAPLFLDRNLEIELIYIEEYEKRIYNPKKAWRRKGWVIEERCLNHVYKKELLKNPQMLYSKIFGDKLPEEFTTKDISEILNIKIKVAQKIVYCFKKMNFFKKIGSKNRFYLYELVDFS